jgi:hypothetical protein
MQEQLFPRLQSLRSGVTTPPKMRRSSVVCCGYGARYGHLMDQSYGDACARLEPSLFGSEAFFAGALER